MKSVIIIVLLSGIVFVSPAMGDGASEESPCLKAFSQPSVRKAFDGSKDEKEPASINYVDSDSKGTFYSIDVGLKVKGCEKETDKVSWSISPSVEFHRSSEREKNVNKKSFALNGESFIGPLKHYGADGSPMKDLDQPRAKIAAPFFLVKTKGTRDSEAHTATASIQALASAFSLRPGLPGRITPAGFRYYPYIGLEYLDQLPVKQGTVVLAHEFSGSFALVRLYAEWYPLRLIHYDRLQIIGTYTYRELLGGKGLDDGNPALFTLGVNLFLNNDETIALGWQLEDGRGPDLGFRDERAVSVTFRVKIGA